MAKAKKLPSGNWRVNQYVGKDDTGKRIYKSFTASTKKEAEFLAAEYVLNHQESENNLTIGQAMQAYIDSKSNILSPSTLHDYGKIKRLRFLDIQDIHIADITNQIIQKSINKESLNLAPKTVSNASGFLSSVLKVYRPDFNYNVSLPAKTRKIKEVLSPETIFDLVRDTEIELPVILSMWLTLRMSELRGIRRKDIKDGYLTINQVKLNIGGRDVVKSSAKNETSKRKLKIPPYIMNLIDKLPSEQEYIVPKSTYSITNKFYKLLENNNLPHMSFHDLRHISASVMLQLNVPDKYAMERGGWATNETLKKVYQHTFSEERKQIDRQIDEYFEKAMQHEMQHTKKEVAQ